jgi:hypothetical protein
LEGDSGWPWMTRWPFELKTSRPAAAIDDSMAERCLLENDQSEIKSNFLAVFFFHL